MAADYKPQNSPEKALSKTYQNKLVNFEKMNYEEERINSFAQWPVNFPVDSKRLAKAGFYYSGYEDEVICFSCRGHIKNWNYGDIVLKKHTELFPDCDFINNKSNNVPLSKNFVKSSKNGYVENLNLLTSASKNNFVQDFTLMKRDSERLKTFCNNWPLTFMDIKELVQSGFFYTGIDDKVQCAYCKGMISKWESGDVPLIEHFKHFPWCDYVSKCFGKPKSDSSLFSSISGDHGCNSNIFSNFPPDICQEQKVSEADSKQLGNGKRLIDSNQHHKSLEQLGVHLHKGPVHPEHTTLSARLRSFISWPSDAPVKKEDLAAAGFFYTGINDQTRCFHCSGGLCRWEKDDDPWVEHARWFCNCDFLRLNKGRDFIQHCLLISSSMHCLQKENIQQNFFPHMEPLINKVDKAMSSKLVRQVIEAELFPSYLVRAAIALKINETGLSFSSVDDLSIAVTHLKEEMDQHNMTIKQSLDAKSYAESDASENHSTRDVSDLKNMGSKSAQKLRCFTVEKDSSHGDTECWKKMSNSEEEFLKDHCLCKICMDREVGLVFLPCGHLLSCTECAPALKYCPMCRKTIQATVRAYLN